MNRRLLWWPVAACAVAWTVLTAAVGNVSFRAEFERGFDADQSDGAGTALVAGAVATAVDRAGTALVLGPGSASCVYEVKGNLALDRGTLVTWLLPTGWKAGGATPAPIVGACQGTAGLAVWWDPATASICFGRRVAEGGTLVVAKAAYDWVQPTWRHVILTWTPQGQALYVDGQPGGVATAGAGLPECGDGQLVIGGDFGAGATLASRGVIVLTEALSERSVQERYRIAASGRVEHERPIVTLAPCASAPTIDGKLAPGEWDLAGGTTGLVEIGGGQLSSVATLFYLTYDQAMLYVACRCPSAEPPVANAMDRDTGSPWDEDSIELWLQPEVGFTGKYFHVVLNAAGSLCDFEDQDGVWNGTASWAATRDKGEWTAEVAVPHASMGTLPPNASTTWQANVCRNVGPSATTHRNTAWAYTGGSGYGVWQWFGAVRFSPAGPVARLDTVSVPAGVQGAEFALQISNPGRQPATLVGSVFLYRQGVAEEAEECPLGPWTLAPGASRLEPVKAMMPFPVDQMKVQIRDAGPGLVLLAQMFRAGAVVPACVVAPPTAVAAAPGAATAVTVLTAERLGEVIRERALWESNRLGITDGVPPPWTPMTVAGRAVSCWGRTYDYGGSLFPAGIPSQGVELLAGPIELVASVGGKTVALQPAAQQSVTPAAHQVAVDATGTAAGVTARRRSQIEYDGCVKVELTLAALGQTVVLDSLELRLLLPKARARYYHWFEATRDPRLTNAGALPAGGLKSHFKPLLWLGDDDRGLCWFSESPKGWAIADRESTLQVEVQNDLCVMRIRLADRPLVIAGQWKTVFGLMATPVRPMPPGWRDWLIPLNQSNPWASWAPGFNNLSGTDDPGTLMPKDAAAMQDWGRHTRQEGTATPCTSSTSSSMRPASTASTSTDPGTPAPTRYMAVATSTTAANGRPNTRSGPSASC